MYLYAQRIRLPVSCLGILSMSECSDLEQKMERKSATMKRPAVPSQRLRRFSRTHIESIFKLRASILKITNAVTV